mgnify:CR=1 FL=1
MYAYCARCNNQKSQIITRTTQKPWAQAGTHTWYKHGTCNSNHCNTYAKRYVFIATQVFSNSLMFTQIYCTPNFKKRYVEISSRADAILKAVNEMSSIPVAPAPVEDTKLGDDEIIALMKDSIAGGAVKEFTSDQVKGWKTNGEETIDGTEYQTGLAAYEAATIFGVRPVQAKALIKDGKIERWVYAKSGMEIQ